MKCIYIHCDVKLHTRVLTCWWASCAPCSTSSWDPEPWSGDHYHHHLELFSCSSRCGWEHAASSHWLKFHPPESEAFKWCLQIWQWKERSVNYIIWLIEIRIAWSDSPWDPSKDFCHSLFFQSLQKPLWGRCIAARTEIYNIRFFMICYLDRHYRDNIGK